MIERRDRGPRCRRRRAGAVVIGLPRRLNGEEHEQTAAVRVLFGSILAWAVFDRISLKRRTDPGDPPIPVGGARQDIIAVVGGTILYLLLGFLFHPWVVGVPAFGPAH